MCLWPGLDPPQIPLRVVTALPPRPPRLAVFKGEGDVRARWTGQKGKGKEGKKRRVKKGKGAEGGRKKTKEDTEGGVDFAPPPLTKVPASAHVCMYCTRHNYINK